MAEKYSSGELVEQRRSRVRVVVTYLAAAYIFVGSGGLIAALWIEGLPDGKFTIAKDVFAMVMPVAAGIIAYWFASRKPDPSAFQPQDGDQGDQGDQGQKTGGNQGNG